MDYRKLVILDHSKDEYEISLDGLRLGIWGRSELRHLIQQIDNQRQRIARLEKVSSMNYIRISKLEELVAELRGVDNSEDE